MNIAIVGRNYKDILKFSSELSRELNLDLVDFNEEFNKILLGFNLPFLLENEILNYKETTMLNELACRKNIVVFMQDDVFISNSNYNLFKDYLIIIVNSNNCKKFKINIKKIIKNNKIIEIDEEKLNFTEIIKEIRGFYDR